MFNKNPTLGCTMYLAPLSVLQSTVIFTVVFWTLMKVAYVMGYYSGVEETPS
jgi:hypothetical protein